MESITLHPDLAASGMGVGHDVAVAILRDPASGVTRWESGKDRGPYDAMNKAAALASGEWIDDADVALLHASAEHGFRPLTLPLVNYDNNQHAANEHLRLGNLWAGIEVFAAVMAGLGGAR